LLVVVDDDFSAAVLDHHLYAAGSFHRSGCPRLI
jgi:hypothetical protein